MKAIINFSLFNKHLKILFIVCVLPAIIPLTSFSPGFLSYGVKTVVIDAGHGGHDPGCLGAFSNEKNVALSISLKLGKLIEENFNDVKVIYTRKTDEFIELHERAKIANSNKADLFICIHCNAGSSTAFGAETYVMGLHRAKDNLSVANRENQVILKEKDYKEKYDGFDPNSAESHIMFSMYQSAFIGQSLLFADKVQKEFKRIGRHDRGVKQAGFLVLYKTTMPSVLIETGFLVNKEEEKTFLGTEDGQIKAAKAIFKAFKQYKTETDGGLKNENNQIEIEKDVEVEKSIVANIKELQNPDGIVFRVQFMASGTQIESFTGFEEVFQYRAGGTYRYLSGEEKSIDKIKMVQEQIVNNGYKDAFIVAFKNGERISLSDALKELK